MLIFFLFYKENSIKTFFLEYYLRLFRKKKTQQEIWLFSPNNGPFIELRLAFFVKQIFL